MSEVKEVVEYSINAPKEAILAWKYDNVTQLVLKLVQNEIQDWQTRLGSGMTLGDKTVEDTARVVGIVQGLGFLDEVLRTQFLQEEDEDESTSPTADIRPTRTDTSEGDRKVPRRDPTRSLKRRAVTRSDD